MVLFPKPNQKCEHSVTLRKPGVKFASVADLLSQFHFHYFVYN